MTPTTEGLIVSLIHTSSLCIGLDTHGRCPGVISSRNSLTSPSEHFNDETFTSQKNSAFLQSLGMNGLIVDDVQVEDEERYILGFQCFWDGRAGEMEIPVLC